MIALLSIFENIKYIVQMFIRKNPDMFIRKRFRLRILEKDYNFF